MANKRKLIIFAKCDGVQRTYRFTDLIWESGVSPEQFPLL
jgi:hypothetical protein